jgi:hypothetical protein
MKDEKIDDDTDSFNSVELTRKSYDELLSPKILLRNNNGKEIYVKAKKQKVFYKKLPLEKLL